MISISGASQKADLSLRLVSLSRQTTFMIQFLRENTPAFLFQRLSVLLLWPSSENILDLMREKTFTRQLLPQAKGLENFQASLGEIDVPA